MPAAIIFLALSAFLAPLSGFLIIGSPGLAQREHKSCKRWVVGTLVVGVAHCSGNSSRLSTKCRTHFLIKRGADHYTIAL
jgi:hypothetical protein